MDALTASQKKALESVLRDRQGFLADVSRQTKAVKGPGGNALYRRNAGHGFQLAYSIVDGSVIVHDMMKEMPSHAPTAKKSKASAAAKKVRIGLLVDAFAKQPKAGAAAKATKARAIKKA
jgi:hypothetical protein